MNLLTTLHKTQLKDFWRFNVYSRVVELIQTYTDRLFAIPKRLIGTPTVDLQSMRLKEQIMIPGELLTKLEVFIRFIDDERDTIRTIGSPNKLQGWHAEVFDNHVKDIRSFCNMCIETDIMINRKASFVPITDFMYMKLVRWLVERCENANSMYVSDTDQFFNMLYSFVYLHHLHYLCGKETYVTGNWNDKRPRDMWEDYEEDRYPYRSYKNSTKGGANYADHIWRLGRNLMERTEYRAIEERMYYYGHLTMAQALCTRAGLYPKMAKSRTANLDIIQFLAHQEYLFFPRNNDNGDHPC